METAITCPVCQCEQTYPHYVQIVFPAYVLNISRKGIKINPAKYEGRGVVIQIGFACETNIHDFSINFAFHKGTTTQTHFEGASLNDYPSVIWRD